MTTFEQLTIDQLDEAAQFIAALNINKKFHIGYCGTNKEDILSDLHEDFIEDTHVNVFVSRHDHAITGLIGFDKYDGIAEIWGPFSQQQHLEQQLQLWHFATAQLEQLKKFLFFVNAENTFQQQFLKTIQAQKLSDELYLTLPKEAFQQVETLHLQSVVYRAPDFEQFEAIHAQAFPNAYYSAKTIIEKLDNRQHQLIVLKEKHIVKGYAYFERNDTLHATHLDFIAIAPDYRGQGLGKQLLQEALTLIFKNEAITQVTLTVNNTNTEANRLYYKTGFQKENALVSYVLNV